MKELFIKVSFALLEQGNREVEVCSNWQLTYEKLGIFFIDSNETLDNNYTLSVMLNEKEIWKSTIRNLPEEGLALPFQSEFMYISSKVLSSKDVPYGDGMLEVILFNADNQEVAVAILSIEDLREAEDCSCNLEETMKLDYEKSIEQINVDPVIEGEEDNEEIEHFSNAEVLEFSSSDVIQLEEIAKEEVVSSVEEIEETLDYKTRLFKNISQYTPVNFYLDTAQEKEEYLSLKKNIVIEKLGSFYITVLNDFQSRPVYFLYNGDQIIEWHNSLEEYILWMEDIIGKMYNIPPSEMKTIEKLIIVTNENEKIENPLGENINWITREKAVENLSNKYNYIVDLNMNYCRIITKDEENKEILNITSEGLAMKNFIDDVDMSLLIKKADLMVPTVNYQWISCIKDILEPISEKSILFVGYAAFPMVYSQLSQGFNMVSELPFVSLSWEV